MITSVMALALYSYLRPGVQMQPLADLIFIIALIFSNIPSGERLPSTEAGVLVNMAAGFALALVTFLLIHTVGHLVARFYAEMGMEVSIDLSFILPLVYTVSLPLASAMIPLLRKLPLYTALLIALPSVGLALQSLLPMLVVPFTYPLLLFTAWESAALEGLGGGG